MFDVAKGDALGAPVGLKGFRLVSKLSTRPSGSGHLLIHGDNALAVDALAVDHAGTVKCIYIDPPYNNLEDYTHYNDKDRHDVWLDRLENHVRQLRQLLTDDGSLWVSIDDRQVHYLKVALDSVFHRKNFITTIIWEHRKTRENRKVFSNNHEYILVYAKNRSAFTSSRNLLPAGEELLSRYRNPDNDPRGPWQSVSLNVQAGHATATQFYNILAPKGTIHSPPKGRCWAFSEERMLREVADNRIWFGALGTGVPRQKRFLCESSVGLTPNTLWRADEVGTTDSAKRGLMKELPDVAVFDTPKPEQLLDRIVRIATNEGDTVLDSFLGSGTTAVVSAKLGRRFIGIERGDHIISHCLQRIGFCLSNGKVAPFGLSSTYSMNFYSSTKV